ncbi:hypothetical protein BIT28_07425 [Photobacterium proteolyticum]|uniref:Uncharacterized protein n=1 Tax=Photobacterium proteolyticum TaxID=1903952 RepID=A0A1Q9H7F2_9GAMM|nr:hypothetical protein [Photobacterium proteolyticum]OLQ83793.1 hypothetical protein BIT28_07425 [Photobacterium proteolyticum]
MSKPEEQSKAAKVIDVFNERAKTDKLMPQSISEELIDCYGSEEVLESVLEFSSVMDEGLKRRKAMSLEEARACRGFKEI